MILAAGPGPARARLRNRSRPSNNDEWRRLRGPVPTVASTARATTGCTNGYEYAGEWFECEIRGQGVARFPNGSVYEGQFARRQAAWRRPLNTSPTAAL